MSRCPIARDLRFTTSDLQWVITTSTAEGQERRRALGIFAAISAGGGGVGLVLGGVLVTYLSWRWVFLINLPIGAAAVVLARIHVPESHARERAGSFDLAGHPDHHRPGPVHLRRDRS